MNKGNISRSKRLSSIVDITEPAGVIADVGCDHGFVSIELVNRNKAKHVIACDINKGPLEAAVRNISEAGLSGSIETRLSDGLHKIKPDDKIETVIIAGMGGRLVTKILSEGKDLLENVSQLVLEPQSELFAVRQFIRENRFCIVKEEFVFDAGKYYWIIDARRGESPEPAEDEIQRIYDNYSEYLIKKKDPLLLEYLEKGIRINEEYLKGIAPEKQGSLLEKIGELKKTIELMQ